MLKHYNINNITSEEKWLSIVEIYTTKEGVFEKTDAIGIDMPEMQIWWHIAIRLLHLFNMCWTNPDMSEEWRLAKVISLFKNVNDTK